MKKQLKEILDSPSNTWLSNLGFIKNADNLSEFRVEFLSRYCSMSSDDATIIIEEMDPDESLKIVKKEYIKFFELCLNPSVNQKAASLIESHWSIW